MSKSYRFDLSHYKGLTITSVTIRVTDGHDEAKAIEHARARNLDRAYFDELVRLSIAAYDDGVKSHAPVFPFTAFDKWSKRTRDVVRRLYLQLNGIAKLKGIDEALDGKPEADGATRFDFSKLPGVDCASVSIREVTGEDEERAIRASLDGTRDVQPMLIAASIARVDDKASTDFDYDALNSRTRSLIATAFNLVNVPIDVPEQLEAVEA